MGTASFEYYQSSRERFLAGLTNLLKIPSISTLPEHRSDVRRACEFLADELRAMSMQQVGIIEGKENQNPLIYAEWNGAPGKPTLLLYGHYDVQPPDPLDEWNSPPFERGENGTMLALSIVAWVCFVVATVVLLRVLAARPAGAQIVIGEERTAKKK